MKTIRVVGLSILLSGLLILIRCSSDADDITNIKQDDDTPVLYESLITDTLFQRGFNIGSTQDGVADIVGVLDYNGTVTETPYWKIAQWYCFNNDLVNALYSVEDNQLCYKISEEGNKILVDTVAGEITLELNAETEYGVNNPRQSGDPWPHLLLQHDWNDGECLKIADKEEIIMDIAYELLKCDNKTSVNLYNSALHTSQFQWFITLQNRKTSSAGYGGEYIWLGLGFFDDRVDFTALYTSEDGGKEENTGAFIYIPCYGTNLIGSGENGRWKSNECKGGYSALYKKCLSVG